MWDAEQIKASGFVLNIAELPLLPSAQCASANASHTCSCFVGICVPILINSEFAIWHSHLLSLDLEFLAGGNQKSKPPCGVQGGVWSPDPSRIWILSLYSAQSLLQTKQSIRHIHTDAAPFSMGPQTQIPSPLTLEPSIDYTPKCMQVFSALVLSTFLFHGLPVLSLLLFRPSTSN